MAGGTQQGGGPQPGPRPEVVPQDRCKPSKDPPSGPQAPLQGPCSTPSRVSLGSQPLHPGLPQYPVHTSRTPQPLCNGYNHPGLPLRPSAPANVCRAKDRGQKSQKSGEETPPLITLPSDHQVFAKASSAGIHSEEHSCPVNVRGQAQDRGWGAGGVLSPLTPGFAR